MATDPKAAPLADELKELALSLPKSAFPKSFFCALCSELAIDSYKLLCCNKAICKACQAKLSFPTTCPSCDHSPLEAESCAPNKSLRNTMRVWLQKQKKKEDAKAAAQAATPAPEITPAATEVPSEVEGADKPIDSVEDVPATGDVLAEPVAAAADAGEGQPRTVSASAPPNEGSTAPGNDGANRRGSLVSQTATQSVEPSAANASSNEQDKTDGTANMMSNNSMVNGMQGQMGFGFQNGMGFNGMPNMMGNAGWNNMNPMDYNMNGMYNNFGGNMGMMNDMSAMNMMNFGGGYGNGWNGMGGGYGNFNGFNQMGGYNQSGAYPEMMNQFPKNNFQNQNQNRFPADQGGALPQQNNRNGSQGGSISGPGGQQNTNSRPGSRSGPARNVRRFHKPSPGQRSLALNLLTPATDDIQTQQRDGESPDASPDAAADSKPEGEQDAAIKPTEEGNDAHGSAQSTAPAADTTINGSEDAKGSTATGDQSVPTQSNGLNQIQTVNTEDGGMQGYDQSMMGSGMQPNMGFANGMPNQFPNQMQMNAPFDPSMNMGYHQNNKFGPRGGFNAAYGAATVLTGEPQGRGVEGAPTGPRAMREGRPNTGFSSRMNNVRYQPPPKSVTPAQSTGARSPQRKARSRSPLRDETLRTRDKSATRSRSKSQARDEENADDRERSRSADRESRREGRGRSVTPQGDDDHERRKDRRSHRSSRHDDREDERDDRHRDDRGSRGDRTRSASADSKYRSSRRDKEKQRSSRSHRDRSKEHRRRHRSRSPADESKYDEEAHMNGDRESESSSRRKHRSDKDKHRDRSRDRDRERDRRDRKDREKDYDYDREKDRSREKDRERRRRRDRDAEEEERNYDDDRYRSTRKSRKDRDREDRDRDDRDRDDRSHNDRDSKVHRPAEDDVVGKMMQKRAASPPPNAPTGPSANTFSIKGAGRSKPNVMPPPQPPTGPRGFQPPKGPAADREKEKHRRKSSASSLPSTPATPAESTSQDHYAAEREKNARERNSRDRVDRDQRDVLSKSLHWRMHSSSSRSSLSSKRPREDEVDMDDAPRGPSKSEVKAPTGPASHRDKRRKSGAGGDNSIANLFTAGLRKNAGKARRGGVRTEGDVEREMERVERERDRR
ncbi:pre-mRNA-splicing factor 38B [Stagonosporopsis vannaccii]|nr:pre-mRNA-splicing factor 38B [Stagonosporopsis vannaccii]